jgi:hypothetical protein
MKGIQVQHQDQDIKNFRAIIESLDRGYNAHEAPGIQSAQPKDACKF